MIDFTASNLTPDLMDPEINRVFENMRDRIARWHEHRTEAIFMSAIIKVCGNMPRFDTILKHATCVVSPDGVRHLIWKGEEIASVKPPCFRPI